MQMILRAIVKSDALSIAAIERECFPLPWTEKEIAEVCARADFCGIVAEANGKVVGYLLGLSLFENAEVLRIAVTKDYRRKKLGGAILDRFFQCAQARGAEQVFLEVRESNAPALGLYKTRGFVQGRVREKYYENGESGVEMSKRLG